MLFTLANREVWVAEIAARMQRSYRPPDRWSLKRLAWSTFLPDMPGPRPGQYAYVVDHALVRFNPSRAILGLEKRGFVLRDRYRRHANLALTVEGFTEARRLGGVAESEIVDLDRLAADWRETGDFWLGEEIILLRDNDARDIVRDWRNAQDAAETAGEDAARTARVAN
jgi:hypothetical protein